jgi:hypothetical protein
MLAERGGFDNPILLMPFEINRINVNRRSWSGVRASLHLS